jgi:hemerythrin-like metal-binding protein
MVNDLYAAMTRRAGKSVLKGILEELTQYTLDHFKLEEELMECTGYPDLKNHQQVHASLVAQVVEFKQQFEAGSTTVTLDLMNFLSDWLINHIKVVDRRYVPHLQGAKDAHALGQATL